MVSGPAAARAAIGRSLAEDPVHGADVRLVDLPATATLDATTRTESTGIGEARKRYMAADVEGCLELLGDDARLDAIVAAGDRSGAARLLFWRTACRVAGEQRAAAEADAETFASLGLRVPEDARDASPDVENLIDRAVQRSQNRPRSELEITANVPRARVTIDGRDATCTAPCLVTAAPGRHVLVARADGAVDVVRATTVTAEPARTHVYVQMTSAPPEVAASQWRDRYDATDRVQSDDSARLLAVATPARYLVLLSAERDDARARLRGLLSFGGEVHARAERTSKEPHEKARDVIDELLHTGKVVESRPLLASPFFWLAAAGAAAAAATVTYFVLRDPDERTQVVFR